MTDIKNKKRLIELPLENFLALGNLTSEKIVLKLKNNDTSHINVLDVNIVDKLIAKIKEKDIPYHLKIENLDKELVMLECINNIEKKLHIEPKINPTIKDFIHTLEKIKNNDVLRRYCGKRELTETYKPLLEYILYQTLSKYSKINEEENQVIDKIKNVTKYSVSNTIINIRSQLLKKAENQEFKYNE